MPLRVARYFERLKGSRLTRPMRRLLRGLGLASPILSLYNRLLVRLAGTIRHQYRGAAAEFQIASYPEYERLKHPPDTRPTLDILLDGIQSDDVFWEVGANVGYISCLVGDKLESGEVLAFEPHPENARRLRSHFRHNNTPGSVHQVGLTDTDGTTAFWIPSLDAGVGTPSITDSDREGEQILIETRRPESMISAGEAPQPDVLYIDAEGAELKVLEGFGGHLGTCREVHCEVHDKSKLPQAEQLAAVEALLESQGFSVRVLNTQHANDFLVASK